MKDKTSEENTKLAENSLIKRSDKSQTCNTSMEMKPAIAKPLGLIDPCENVGVTGGFFLFSLLSLLFKNLNYYNYKRITELLLYFFSFINHPTMSC